MKIFTAAQIRSWDQFTISREPISSIQLMERASATVANGYQNIVKFAEKPLFFVETEIMVVTDLP